VDFKGELKLGLGRYCCPLTVADQASRFLHFCEARESTREVFASAERIEPGHPSRTAVTSGMHLSLKKEATRPPGMNSPHREAASKNS
jgi:hypothetical protein